MRSKLSFRWNYWLSGRYGELCMKRSSQRSRTVCCEAVAINSFCVVDAVLLDFRRNFTMLFQLSIELFATISCVIRESYVTSDNQMHAVR